MARITLAVLKGRLEQIADQKHLTLFRAAFNPTIAEAHDACHGRYDHKSLQAEAAHAAYSPGWA